MSNPVAEQTYINIFEQRTATPKKRTVAIVVLFFILMLLLGAIRFFYTQPFIEIVIIVGAFLLGLIYVLLLEKASWSINNIEGLGYSVVLTASICLALSAFYYYAGELQLVKVISFSSAFILPYLVKEVWRSYKGLPGDHHHLWFYSKEIPTEPLFAYLETKRIKFKVMKPGAKPKYFSAAIPTSLNVGVGFYYMLKEKDKSTPWTDLFLNEKGEPYGWTFYISRYGLWKKYLQPDDNLVDNKIHSGNLIIAKRVT